jgi:hypothetical protein
MEDVKANAMAAQRALQNPLARIGSAVTGFFRPPQITDAYADAFSKTVEQIKAAAPQMPDSEAHQAAVKALEATSGADRFLLTVDDGRPVVGTGDKLAPYSPVKAAGGEANLQMQLVDQVHALAYQNGALARDLGMGKDGKIDPKNVQALVGLNSDPGDFFLADPRIRLSVVPGTESDQHGPAYTLNYRPKGAGAQVWLPLNDITGRPAQFRPNMGAPAEAQLDASLNSGGFAFHPRFAGALTGPGAWQDPGPGIPLTLDPLHGLLQQRRLSGAAMRYTGRGSLMPPRPGVTPETDRQPEE